MSEEDRKNESVDFVQNCLEVSQDNDILLEVVYTALLNLDTDREKIDKSMQDSLWYWLKFKAKSDFKEENNPEKIIRKLQQLNDVYSK